MKISGKRLLTDVMLKIDDRYFAFDVRKICSFIYDVSRRELKESEILDTYDFTESGTGKMNAKTVRELTTPGGNQDTVAYDLLKIFIIQVVAFDGDGDIDLDSLPFGTKLAFNTLISEGFLKEVNE